jgi:hypothetical protein
MVASTDNSPLSSSWSHQPTTLTSPPSIISSGPRIERSGAVDVALLSRGLSPILARRFLLFVSPRLRVYSIGMSEFMLPFSSFALSLFMSTKCKLLGCASAGIPFSNLPVNLNHW